MLYSCFMCTVCFHCFTAHIVGLLRQPYVSVLINWDSQGFQEINSFGWYNDTVENSSVTAKHLYLILTFRSRHEIFIRRSCYSVLPSLDATISCRIKKAERLLFCAGKTLRKFRRLSTKPTSSKLFRTETSI